MARYIDADKAHEGIEAIQTSLESNDDREWRKNKPYYKGLAWARGVIDETPTADVAPRAEVDFLKKTIAENAQKALEVTLEEVENAKREVAREIFEEIERNIVTFEMPYQILHCIPQYYITELKKKYTQ